MRNALIYISLFVTCAALIVSSCTKSEKNPTPADLLVGKWRLYQSATDDNNNKVLDDQEVRTTDPNIITTLTFSYGDSGIEEVNYYGELNDYYFTWKLPNSSETLIRFSEGHDTLIQGIVTFSPARLELLDSTGVTYSWHIYRKL